MHAYVPWNGRPYIADNSRVINRNITDKKVNDKRPVTIIRTNQPLDATHPFAMYKLNPNKSRDSFYM
jgi:hypothetical protein